jgi:hypothetical protein
MSCTLPGFGSETGRVRLLPFRTWRFDAKMPCFCSKTTHNCSKTGRKQPFLRPDSSRIIPISHSFIDSYKQVSAYNSSCKMGRGVGYMGVRTCHSDDILKRRDTCPCTGPWPLDSIVRRRRVYSAKSYGYSGVRMKGVQGRKLQRGPMGRGRYGSMFPRVALRSTLGYFHVFPTGRPRLILQNERQIQAV